MTGEAPKKGHNVVTSLDFQYIHIENLEFIWKLEIEMLAQSMLWARERALSMYDVNVKSIPYGRGDKNIVQSQVSRTD